MQVTFYKLSKVYNSTKRPEGGGSVVTCEIDEPCSILTPKLKLNFGQTNPPTDFNYCEIPDFKRSYYTSNWTYAHGLWYCDLTVDVMCTYRDNIGKSRQYILRASNDNEDSLLDMAYPTEAGIYPQQKFGTLRDSELPDKNLSFTPIYDKGCYVIGIIGQGDHGNIGAVNYYIFRPYNFNKFLQLMLSDVDWLGIDEAEISKAMVKVLYNPLEYIVSCQWLPFEYQGKTDISSIKFGFWELAATASTGTGTITFEGEVEIPKHPQAESEFSYFNLSPYSRYTFFAPPFGEIPLDTTILMNYKQLDYDIVVDFVSGTGILYLSVGQTARPALTAFMVKRSQVSVPVQLSNITRDYTGVAANVLSTLGNLFDSNLGGVAHGIASSATAMLPQVSSTGSNGTSAEYEGKIKLFAGFIYQRIINNDYNGRPLCDYKTVRNLKGYMQCENAKVEIAGYRSEMTEIENIMNTGFYYE